MEGPNRLYWHRKTNGREIEVERHRDTDKETQRKEREREKKKKERKMELPGLEGKIFPQVWLNFLGYINYLTAALVKL